MSKTLIVIPSRMKAVRLPNKPLKLINSIPMVVQVYNRAKESKVGEVIIATPDKEIIEIGKKFSCKTILTKNIYNTGTDRVFAAFNEIKDKKFNYIINLQGDMPNINPSCIRKLNNIIKKKKIKICTLASALLNNKELENRNIVKILTKKPLNNKNYLIAKDFFRLNKKLISKNIYHHVGIYGFTAASLKEYVNLKRSKNEKSRNLEQMRAIDNNINVHVALSSSIPLSVDTKDELLEIKKIMEYKS